MLRIRSRLLAFVAVIGIALPLVADLNGITTTPIDLPAKVYASAVGPDGNLWILTDKANLGKLTAAGSYTEFPLQFGKSVFSVTPGIDGNLWIPGPNGHVERVTTSGVVTDFAVAPDFYFPYPAVSGADGAIWFYGNQSPSAGGSNTWKLGRIDIYGHFTTYDLGISDLSGSGDFLRGLVSGGDGNLWFIDETRNQVLKFSLVTKGIVGTYAIPSSGGADQMTLGWDGNVWFTRAKSIDRVTPDGEVTEFAIPSGGQPAAILMSGDGNIWFTEPSSGKLGQLVMSSITAGGTATINETAFAPSAEQIFLNLPPAFAGSPGVTQAIGVVPNNACPPVTKLGVDSRTGKPVLMIEPPPPDCIRVTEAQLIGFADPLAGAAIAIGCTVSSDSIGPVHALDLQPLVQPAAVTAVLNLSAAPGVAISNVSASDPSAIVSFSALRASITSSTSVAARVSVSTPAGVQSGSIAGAVVLSANATDPDPRQHVASFFLDRVSLSGRGGLPSNAPTVVITPVKRGK